MFPYPIIDLQNVQNTISKFYLPIRIISYIIINNIHITVMIKATIYEFLQRAGGWCESVKLKILPLLELSVKSRKVSTLYRTIEWLDRISFSNLGGNADSFRPMFYVWVGRIFLFCATILPPHSLGNLSYIVNDGN